MCGIVGFVNKDKQRAELRIVKAMTDLIVHRGPDGEGQVVHNNVGLGHRRLSIIDLSQNASQPMACPHQRYIISYNGEIYNFKDLRKELEGLGHSFHSQSDTEVALTAYREWGEKAVKKFNGMFALVIFDKEKNQLFFARDRYGIKPLYLHSNDNVFAFASENKAFLAHPHYKDEVDHEGLLEYMTFQNFFSHKTLFKNVHLFPPGHYATYCIESNTFSKTKYWDYSFGRDPLRASENELIEELDHLFVKAVKRQLVSDVEIGTYLSGGMDSGSITAIAAREHPYIKTFTVGFDLNSASGLEMAFDEREKAESMSYAFSTEHYEMVLKAGDMQRCMKKLVYHLEEPRVGQSYPNYYAAKLASKFNKVVLSGCGGDEIFAGYPWRYYRSLGHSSFEKYVDDYYAYWQRLIPNRLLPTVLAPIYEQVKDVWTRDIFRDVYLEHAENFETSQDYINHSLYLEAKTFLHGLLLVEDKLSMAHSLESRVPFLDNDLVDFSMKIPLNYKLSHLGEVERMNENIPGRKKDSFFKRTKDGKQILRKMMSRYIPTEVTERVKQGFSAPDASWFKGESIDFVKDQLCHPQAKIYQYLDFQTTHKLIQEHLTGAENRRLLVWSLLNLEELFQGRGHA